MKEEKLLKKETLGSRTYANALLLTFAGGYLDAYTYSSRGGVFANAQTGNIVKLGISLAKGEPESCLRFLIPIIAFCLGTLAALMIAGALEHSSFRFIRRGILVIEMFVICVVSIIPQSAELNIVANVLVSFMCAMQMEGFKTFVGQPMTTTVATGNLRKSVEFLYEAVKKKDWERVSVSFSYLFVILVFIFGAYIGMLVTEVLGVSAISYLLVLYIISFLLITVKRYKESGSF